MTVKEIAEFTSKNETTVRRWVKKASAKMTVINDKMTVSSPMKPADYNIEEVEAILNSSNLGVNAVCIVMANAREKKPVENNAIDYEALTKSITIAVMSALSPMIAKVTEYSNYQQYKELSAPKQNRDALRQLIGKYARKNCDGDHREAWGFLYEEIYYRLKVNIRVRAKNEGVSKLDIIESLGYIDQCCLILSEEVK